MLTAQSLPAIVTALGRLLAAVADPQIEPDDKDDKLNPAYCHILGGRTNAALRLLTEGRFSIEPLEYDKGLPPPVQDKLEELKYVLMGQDNQLIVCWGDAATVNNRPGLMRFLDEAATTLGGAASSKYHFKWKGDCWVIRFEAEEYPYHDSKGLCRIAKLLRQPGKPIPSLVLVDGDERLLHATHSDQEAVAPESIREIKRALDALEREESGAKDDPALLADVRERRELLEAQLKRDMGRSGKSRRVDKSKREQAHDTARKTIGDAIKKLGEQMPGLAKHLAASIKPVDTSYLYDPSPSIPWIL